MTNRKHIRFIKAPQRSPEWLALRKDGIGGSEIGAVLGIAEYSDPIKVFLEKIGEAPPFEGNRFTRMGRLKEDFIAHLYKFWDHDNPSCEQCLINEELGKRFNKIERVNGYIVNDKYPWLFASLDRKIVNDKRGRGHLETKNTTSQEKNRYAYGFNESFMAQVQHYLLIDEADYSDVAIHYDGNNFDVKPVLPIKELQDHIIQISFDFWHNKVLPARKIKEEAGIESYYGMHLDFVPREKQEAVYKLMQLEPELSGTEKEYEFIQKLVIPTAEFTEMKGTDEQYQLVLQYAEFVKQGKEAKRQATAIKEKLVLSLGGYHQASWGEREYISYKPTKRGPRFRVSPSLVPDETEE